MIIVSVKVSARGGEFTFIGDGGECYTVSLADAKRLGLSELSEEDLPIEFSDEDRLEFLSQKLSAVKYCSYLLGFSDKSESVLTRKMREKEYSKEIIDEALSVLRDSGITDDRELCLKKYNLIAKTKLYGPHRIKSELFAKGFTSEDIRFAEENTDADFDENIKELYARIIRTQRIDFHDKASVSKLISKLVRYGYSSGAVRLVMNEVSDDFDD